MRELIIKLIKITFISILPIMLLCGCRDHSRHIPDITVSPGDDVVSNWITISEPEYGEVWQPGSVHEIKWKSNTEIERVNISVWKKKKEYLFNIMSDLENTGSYTWEIPLDVTTTNHAHIRISSTNDGKVEGFSEVFYLRP